MGRENGGRREGEKGRERDSGRVKEKEGNEKEGREKKREEYNVHNMCKGLISCIYWNGTRIPDSSVSPPSLFNFHSLSSPPQQTPMQGVAMVLSDW